MALRKEIRRLVRRGDSRIARGEIRSFASAPANPYPMPPGGVCLCPNGVNPPLRWGPSLGCRGKYGGIYRRGDSRIARGKIRGFALAPANPYPMPPGGVYLCPNGVNPPPALGAFSGLPREIRRLVRRGGSQTRPAWGTHEHQNALANPWRVRKMLSPLWEVSSETAKLCMAS